MSEVKYITMELSFNFIEVCLYYWFFCEKMHKHFSGIKKWLCMLFFTVITIVPDKLGVDPTVKLICLFVVIVFFSMWVYKCKISTAILWNSVFTFAIIASESLGMGISLVLYGEHDTSMSMETSLFRLHFGILSIFLTFVLLLLCVKLLDQKREEYTMKEIGILLLQAVTSMLCLVMIVEFNFYGKEFGLGMLFLTILALVISASYVVSYYLIDGYFSYRAKEKEMLLMDMRNEKMMDNYAQIEKNQNHVYQLYHDLKKHMHAMLLLENREETEKYIEECFKDIREVDGEFHTGNRFVDAILYDEWKKAVDAGIRVQFAVETGSFAQMELPDITVILGNALENAREACIKRIANRKSACIQLKAIRQEQQTVIVVSNEFDGKLTQKGNVFVSSKENPHLHGIGMKSIQTAVEKYQGSMKVSVRDDKFRLMLLLCFPDETETLQESEKKE